MVQISLWILYVRSDVSSEGLRLYTPLPPNGHGMVLGRGIVVKVSVGETAGIEKVFGKPECTRDVRFKPCIESDFVPQRSP